MALNKAICNHTGQQAGVKIVILLNLRPKHRLTRMSIKRVVIRMRRQPGFG